MRPRRLFLLFHGRFPSEKAAAIFVAESAKAYAAHLPVTIVAPARRGRGEALPSGATVAYMPSIDLFTVPLVSAIAFPISYLVFSVASFFYLLAHERAGDLIETNEWLPALCATLLSRNVVYELHDFPGRMAPLYHLLFARARLIIATNEWKARELERRFGIPARKVVMERNGVDLDRFAPHDKAAARRALGIAPDARIALYGGHLYGWKGVDALAEAASLVPEAELYVVGGTERDLERFRARHSAPNIRAVGHRPHDEMPHWLAAADALILPNTAKEEISARYTSPMKLFEYMAAGRPIVASRLPSITEVLSEETGYLVDPDSPKALAAGIRAALQDDGARPARARALAERLSWAARAERILAHIG